MWCSVADLRAVLGRRLAGGARRPFDTTLGNVVLLVSFGAVLGRMVEVSGGAQVVADALGFMAFGLVHGVYQLS